VPRHLPTIIKDLAHSSLLADSIAKRLSSYSTSSDLSIETTEYLTSEIDRLRHELDRQKALIQILEDNTDDDEELTDEQEATFMKSMAVILEKLPLVELRFGYAVEVMVTYPTRLRYLIAIALINTCTERGFTPEPIWQELLSKHGVI